MDLFSDFNNYMLPTQSVRNTHIIGPFSFPELLVELIKQLSHLKKLVFASHLIGSRYRYAECSGTIREVYRAMSEEAILHERKVRILNRLGPPTSPLH